MGDYPGGPPGVITISMILVRLGLMGYEYLNGSLVIFNSGFCLPGRGAKHLKIGPKGSGIGPFRHVELSGSGARRRTD